MVYEIALRVRIRALLIPAGTAIHCAVNFLEPFTSSFAKEGKLREGVTPNTYERDLRIEIGWVEADGTTQSAVAKIGRYGFSEGGDINLFSPLEKKHDLYKLS